MAVIDNKAQSGTTLIELLVAMAIIAIMSGILVIQVRQSDSQVLKEITNRTASDLKQIRNLATARVVNENNEYPVGGYGIYFDDSVTPSYYIIFSDNGYVGYQDNDCNVVMGSCPDDCFDYCDDTASFIPDSLIHRYNFTSDDVEVYATGFEGEDQFYFTFITEHTATSSVSTSNEGATLEIRDTVSLDKGVVRVFDTIEDDFIWGNINVMYE